MKNLRTIALLGLLTLTSTSAFSQDRIPVIRTLEGPSLNWSGYAINIANVTSVTGTFTVPTISGPGSIGDLTPDLSAWVGIDGYTSGTVEQLGIAGNWDDATGKAVYTAWWEMYPRVSTTIKSMTISAGDSITASVVYIGGGSFTLSMTNNSNHQSFAITTSAPVGGPNAALRTSAEWIVERAATIDNGFLTILPLATFDSVGFSGASFKVGNGSPITLQNALRTYPELVDGKPVPTPPYWEQITMVDVDSNGNPIPLDSISAVKSSSFTAEFLANGNPLPIPGVFRH